MKALLLSPYPSSAPSNRNRLDQYLPYLRSQGIDVSVDCLQDEDTFRSRGGRHAMGVLRGSFRRLAMALRPQRFDTILVHREALPLPTALLETMLRQRAGRVVFDFDDAIYLPQPYPTSQVASWLRSPKKFRAMVASADLTIAGNGHLAERAMTYSSNVMVIPTPVDTDRIYPASRINSPEKLVIGWIGSASTAHYLADIARPLCDILERYPHVELAVVGAALPKELRRARVHTRPWTLEREAQDLSSFDIGIMPLPDNEWTRGKCAYKALQYMAAGVATVSSAVGATLELVRHGDNGLLARSEREWVICLARLIEDGALRKNLGEAGRQTVDQHYSVRVWAPEFAAGLIGRGLALRPATRAARPTS